MVQPFNTPFTTIANLMGGECDANGNNHFFFKPTDKYLEPSLHNVGHSRIIRIVRTPSQRDLPFDGSHLYELTGFYYRHRNERRFKLQAMKSIPIKDTYKMTTNSW